jgi:uncharacterized membrane protein
MSLGQPYGSAAPTAAQKIYRRQLGRHQPPPIRAPFNRGYQNVSQGERVVSVAAGSILALLGLGRRDLPGLLIASVGGALAYRGTTGHCHVYDAIQINTTGTHETPSRLQEADKGVHVTASFLINKSPEVLYSFWRNFENLPQFMSHLESVRMNDDQTSHWVAKAPSIYGGTVEWDAELVAEEPNSYISWRSIPGSDVNNSGSIKFTRALGDRGTNVRVDLRYEPPFGQVGRWIAKLFGEEPEQQIQDDLRRFKRLMELGEIPTLDGQSHGTCRGTWRVL